LWAYGPTLGELVRRWSDDPQYSHGFLVPVFALVLLAMRREWLAPVTFGFRWGGVALVAVGLLLHLVGTYFYFDWLDAFSLLPCLAGLVVLVGGRAALRWAWPAIAFLLFMIPLPYQLEVAAALPLQRITTAVSTYAMQTLGLAAFAVDNIIILENGTLRIVSACSGLSMLMVFFAMAVAMAIVARRVWWEKLVLVASAVPIALFANVIRITIAGIFYEASGAELARMVIHQWAGWLMMPLAFGMLALELWALGRLMLAPPPRESDTSAPRPPAPPPSRSRGRWRKRDKAPALPNLANQITRTPAAGRPEPDDRIRR
jgi:exosortase